MNEIKIEKGLPLVPYNNTRWPFDSMEIGDSFLIPSQTKSSTVSAAARFHSKIKGTKFSVRKTPDGHRCWRIA
jgi:hypothetical protein